MNILPAIDNSKKKFRFSNPLSGTVYNNNHYLKQCHYQADPQMINSMKKRRKHIKANSSVIQNQSMNRLSSPASKRKLSSINKSRNQNLNKLFQNSQTKYIEKYHKTQKSTFKFPDVEIKIIDQIQCLKDFFEKILKVNLQHYYGMYFKKTLAGSFTAQLVDIVEKYIQILVQSDKIDSVVETKDYPSEYFSLKSKRSFLQKVQQLESKNNSSAILQMIKFYCIPSKQFRQSCFRDIIHMLSQSLYEKFNLNKEKDYVLLDQNGNLINQICEIKFSTTLLLISTRTTYEKSYSKYKNIIQSDLLNFQKFSFNQNIKKNFRGMILKGKYDETNFNIQNEQKKEDSLQKRKLAESKILARRSSDKSLKKFFDPAKTTTSFPYNKSQQKKDIQNKRSKSSLGQSKTLMDKLAGTKVTSMNARKRYEFYDQIYERLQTFNAVYDTSYNYSTTDKLLIKVLRKQFQLFRSKTNQQVDAILKAFKINPNEETINKEQFYRINEVIRCKGDHIHIVEFVSKYLPFNEYGELEKDNLEKTLKFILNDEAGEEVVLNIIWSWLQKNGLIQNGVLVRNTLESWYEKNKMAFVIMVSFIFGTNQNSWVDMAYEVLV